MQRNSKQKLKGNSDKVSCQTCGAELSNQQNLNKHKLVHSEGGSFPCNSCPKEFQLQYDLSRHYERVHCQRLKCKHCRKTFKSESLLESHVCLKYVSIGDLKGGIMCMLCREYFRNKKGLNSHIRCKHKIGDVEKISCDMCHKTFASVTYMKQHKQMHLPQHLPCKTCGKIFLRKQALLKHMKMHAGEKEYQCHQCDKRYTTSS